MGRPAIPGPKWLTAPLTLVLTSTVAWRRWAPLAAGVVAMACNTTLIVAADSAGTSVAQAAHVLSKLGLRDRVRAVILAYEAGVVVPHARG